MSPVIKRHSIRALLLTQNREVLLLRVVRPGGKDAFWIAPGGGIEPGETIEAGLRRELMEELGFKDFVIGHEVWRRQHTFNWGEKRLCQSEQYYVVHIDRPFEPLCLYLISGFIVPQKLNYVNIFFVPQ
ncbi:MAG: NUDIX domain-containing protein [Chthoniobacteraceae bacterium]